MGYIFFTLKIVKLEGKKKKSWLGKEFTRKEAVTGLFNVYWRLMMNIQFHSWCITIAEGDGEEGGGRILQGAVQSPGFQLKGHQERILL